MSELEKANFLLRVRPMLMKLSSSPREGTPRTFGWLRQGLALAGALLASGSLVAQIQRITVDSDAPSAAAGGVSVYSSGNEIIREADGSLTVAYARNHPIGATGSPNFVYLARSKDAGAHWTYQRTDQFTFVARPDCLLRLPSGGYVLGTTYNNLGFVNRSTNGTDWLPLNKDSELGRIYPLSSTVTTSGVVMDVDAAGTIHMAYTRSFDGGQYPYNVGYRTSKDGGATWSAETDITQVPNNLDQVGFGAWYPTLTVGPAGTVFIAYSRFYKTNIVSGSVTNTVHYNVPQLSVFDGTKWLEPKTFGDPSISWFSYPAVSTDAAGNLHTIHVQHPGKLASGRVIYQKLPRGGSTFSDPVLISPATNNAVNIALGVFESDTVLVGWDDAEYTGSALNYRAVYAASSADGFQNLIRVSAPGTIGRAPAIRNRIGAFSSAEKMDIVWTESNPSTGSDVPPDRLMFADLGPVITRPLVASIVDGPTAATLKFTGVSGRRYQVESSSTLSAWTAVGSPVTASTSVISVDLPKSAATGFFRVTDVTP